jgi:hypothetical protein
MKVWAIGRRGKAAAITLIEEEGMRALSGLGV